MNNKNNESATSVYGNKNNNNRNRSYTFISNNHNHNNSIIVIMIIIVIYKILWKWWEFGNRETQNGMCGKKN